MSFSTGKKEKSTNVSDVSYLNTIVRHRGRILEIRTNTTYSPEEKTERIAAVLALMLSATASRETTHEIRQHLFQLVENAEAHWEHDSILEL